jgi:tetratricopeptide (TPR) repeat protein
MGLVERRSGNCDAEVTDFEQVVAQYPDARDARRELGISYYQTHRYEEARTQFEALQRIDPDDLAAHYNLAVIYRRLGMKDKAAQQAALFATKQVDPGAPTYSLSYLRRHPEISIESVPMHVHTDESQVPLSESTGRH